MASVKIHDIKKSFGNLQVLNGVSIDIKDGEFVVLVGPSGCGKSTLLRIIAGLERQSSGNIDIADETVDDLHASRRDIAMVFQSYALYPHLTVAKNIAVPLQMRRLNFLQRLPYIGRWMPGTTAAVAGIDRDVTEAAEMLDIQHLMDRKPGQLSGGQRQRVAVGRAMVRHPKAFLMDEPLSNLDAELRVHMRAEITELHRRLATTFIYVTHDQTEAMTMADRVAVMMDGNLLQVDTPSNVYSNPADIRVAEFIGSPRINILPATIDQEGQVSIGGRHLPGVMTSTQEAEIRVGIRPENVSLVEAGGDGFSCRITYSENTGADAYFHLELNIGGKIITRMSAAALDQFPVGSEAAITLNANNALLFDKSGARIRYENKAPDISGRSDDKTVTQLRGGG